MDIDEQNRNELKQSDNAEHGEGCSYKSGKTIPTCKVQMDWENSTEDNQSSDVLLSDQLSDTFDDADADDEQSDWPESTVEPKGICLNRISHGNLLRPSERHASDDAPLDLPIIKRIERFLQNSGEKELQLDQVYRTSAIKQMLRKQPVAVHIVKRGRGTIALVKKETISKQ